ncbi:MAG TPA: DUF1059 domain-containing protein [Terriglobales bacterium]|jgi:predicted small metal-binding protein|nr:DUF1059 domain-containing protein [Terriglobales bacterium]
MADQPQKSFRCADAGMPQCDFEARGKTEEEVMRQVEQHGREAHGLQLSDKQKEELKKRIRAA